MKSWNINRRTFLRGVGVSIALPWLEGMTWAAEAKNVTSRICFNFFPFGVSMPKDDSPDRMKLGWFPVGEGNNYKLTDSHKSMEAFRKKLTYFGGLSHPLGRKVPGHSAGDVYLTGADISAGVYRQSISVDQVAAEVVGKHTRYPSLVFSSTGGFNFPHRSSTLSYDKNGRPIPSEHRPKEIFQRLFAPVTESNREKRRTKLEDRASILDVVRDEATRLDKRLGRRDKEKMDEYLTSVRAVEKRIQKAQNWLDVQKPKVDPKSVNVDVEIDDIKDFIRSKYDLMALAFQTDSTRVATYQIAGEGDGIESKFPSAVGISKTAHGISHSHYSEDQANYARFLIDQHAYFLERLESIQEGNGTLLDNTMVLYGCCTSVTHRSRNYPLILAGGSNLGFKHGRYLKYGDDVPLSNLFVTMLDRMKVPVKSFKDSTGELSDVVS